MGGNNSIAKECRLQTEDARERDGETIVYFDKLGFGWVLSHIDVDQFKQSLYAEGKISNQSLIRMIESLLYENTNA
jgi:hypothetical protein